MEYHKGETYIAERLNSYLDTEIRWTWTNNITITCKLDGLCYTLAHQVEGVDFDYSEMLYVDLKGQLVFDGEVVFKRYERHVEEVEHFLLSFQVLNEGYSIYEFWDDINEVEQRFDGSNHDHIFLFYENGSVTYELGYSISPCASNIRFKEFMKVDEELATAIEIFPSNILTKGFKCYGKTYKISYKPGRYERFLTRNIDMDSEKDLEYLEKTQEILEHMNHFNEAGSTQYYKDLFMPKKGRKSDDFC